MRYGPEGILENIGYFLKKKSNLTYYLISTRISATCLTLRDVVENEAVVKSISSNLQTSGTEGREDCQEMPPLHNGWHSLLTYIGYSLITDIWEEKHGGQVGQVYLQSVLLQNTPQFGFSLLENVRGSVAPVECVK